MTFQKRGMNFIYIYIYIYIWIYDANCGIALSYAYNRPYCVNGTFILVWCCDVTKLRRAPAFVVIRLKKGLWFLNQFKLFYHFTLFYLLRKIN